MKTLLGLLMLLVTLSVARAERPNVLFILTDNQSYYELGVHGHPHLRTPRIDRLAAESVDFVNFHAPPFCSPSRALLLTGRYAMRSGIHNTIGGVSILHRQEQTLADALQTAGYQTAIFGKWHLGFSYPYHPNLRGFDEAFVHGGGGIGQLEDFFGNSHLNATFDHNGQAAPTTGFTTDVLFERAEGFVRDHQDQPFFCFVSTPATHRPWQAHPESAAAIRDRGEDYGRNDMALYSMVENIDQNVGRMLDLLDDLGLAERTLVIVATDQGTRRERLHRGLGYDEYHRVFCMMRYPDWTKGKGRQSQALTGMVDVFPTVLDACGVNSPNHLDGRSLKPLLTGEAFWRDDRRLIVQCPRGRERRQHANVSVKSQRWRLVDDSLLFDIERDPDQLNNVFGRNPGVVASLRGSYARFWDSLPSAETLLSRHSLGDAATGEVRLNAMDWYQGGAPWHQLHMPKFEGNGKWAIDVVRGGRYRFELRHQPREASAPLGAVLGAVTVGEQTARIDLTEADPMAVIEMELSPGHYDLETSLLPGPGSFRTKPWGALFAYVQRLE